MLLCLTLRLTVLLAPPEREIGELSYPYLRLISPRLEAPFRWRNGGVRQSYMGPLCPEAWVFRNRTKDPLSPEADFLRTLWMIIFSMCAAMITGLATIASLAAMGLASPIPGNTDIIGCVDSWDSWGIACPYLRHHLYCDNLPGVLAGT